MNIGAIDLVSTNVCQITTSSTAWVGMYDLITQPLLRFTSVVPRFASGSSVTFFTHLRDLEIDSRLLDHVNREEGTQLTPPEENSVLLPPLHTIPRPSISGFHARTTACLTAFFSVCPE